MAQKMASKIIDMQQVPVYAGKIIDALAGLNPLEVCFILREVLAVYEKDVETARKAAEFTSGLRFLKAKLEEEEETEEEKRGDK